MSNTKMKNSKLIVSILFDRHLFVVSLCARLRRNGKCQIGNRRSENRIERTCLKSTIERKVVSRWKIKRDEKRNTNINETQTNWFDEERWNERRRKKNSWELIYKHSAMNFLQFVFVSVNENGIVCFKNVKKTKIFTRISFGMKSHFHFNVSPDQVHHMLDPKRSCGL